MTIIGTSQGLFSVYIRTSFFYVPVSDFNQYVFFIFFFCRENREVEGSENQNNVSRTGFDLHSLSQFFHFFVRDFYILHVAKSRTVMVCLYFI